MLPSVIFNLGGNVGKLFMVGCPKAVYPTRSHYNMGVIVIHCSVYTLTFHIKRIYVIIARFCYTLGALSKTA